jgi:hypothetical protein
MTLNEACDKRIARLKRPCWTTAYLKIDLVEEKYMGPWMHLFDRACQQVIGEPTPQTLLNADSTSDYVPYDGPLDEADK